MKINVYYTVLLLASVLLVQSCDSDGDDAREYDDGILVVNEGRLGTGTGTVTYVDDDDEEVFQNIYRNSEGFAGDVLQSVTVADGRAYLVLNGDNKIEIADERSFRGQGTITAPAIDKPRYVEFVNGKAFLSVWGPYDENYSLIDSYVLVLNAQTMQVLDTVDTDEGVENLLYNGTYLFATNYNYGASNSLAIIDPSDHELVDQIELYAGPAGMVLDKNGKLWLIATGTYEGNDGKLFRIDPTSFAIEEEIDLGVNPGEDLAITPDKSTLIYRAGTGIFRIDIDDETAPESPFITVAGAKAPSALGVDPENGRIYFGDAVDYASPGVISVFNADGSLVWSFQAGITPTQFIFRD